MFLPYINLKLEINQHQHCFALFVSNYIKRSTISVASPLGGLRGQLPPPHLSKDGPPLKPKRNGGA